MSQQGLQNHNFFFASACFPEAQVLHSKCTEITTGPFGMIMQFLPVKQVQAMVTASHLDLSAVLLLPGMAQPQFIFLSDWNWNIQLDMSQAIWEAY